MADLPPSRYLVSIPGESEPLAPFPDSLQDSDPGPIPRVDRQSEKEDAMLDICLEFLFGCVHHHQTRPFTINKNCYTVCLDCGRELPYSWAEMRTLRHPDRTLAHRPACEEVKAAA